MGGRVRRKEWFQGTGWTARFGKRSFRRRPTWLREDRKLHCRRSPFHIAATCFAIARANGGLCCNWERHSFSKSVRPIDNPRSGVSDRTRSFKMKRIQTAYTAGVSLAVLGLAVGFAGGQARPTSAQQQPKNEIKILDNPGGGQYAFGPMTSQSNK